MNKKHEQITLTRNNKPVRIIKNNGYYVVANELAEALGYSNGRSAIFKNVSDENKFLKPVFTDTQYRDTNVLNVVGAEELISNCQLTKVNSNIEWIKENVIAMLNKLNGENDIFGVLQDYINANELIQLVVKKMSAEKSTLEQINKNYKHQNQALSEVISTQRNSLIEQSNKLADLEGKECFICKLKNKLGLSKY